MKKIILIVANIFFAASICLSQNSKKDDKLEFTQSKNGGSFLTLLADNTLLKEEWTIEESSQKTKDGGTSTLLKVEAKKSKASEKQAASEAIPQIADSVTIINADIIIYPNPVNNQLTVKTNVTTTEGRLTLVLYDFNGNEVKRVENIKPVGEISIPRAELKQGDFIYKVFNSSKVLASGRLKVN